MSDGHEPRPRHARGDRHRPPRGRLDRDALARRLPAVVVLVAAVAGALVADATRAPGRREGAMPDGPAATVLPMPVSPPAGHDSSTWYCAAGTAERGGSADHTVSIQNPTDGDLAAAVTVVGGGVMAAARPTPAVRPVVEAVDLPARSTTRLRLGDLVEAPLAAAVVEVDGGDVVVEHRVAGRHGDDVGPCSPAAAGEWHLAWGSTGRDAREVVVLLNPFPTGATVDARFATGEGGREPVRFQGVPVPPHSVVGLDVGDAVAAADQVSATVRARSGRIVVERLVELDGSFGLAGLDVELASPTAGTAWAFAEGGASSPGLGPPDVATGRRAPSGGPGGGGDRQARPDPRDDPDATVASERIVIYNPGDRRAEVDVELRPVPADASPPTPFRLVVGPGRFEVVDEGAQARVVPGVPHATVVRSTNGVPVVAERVTADHGPEVGAGRRRSEVTAALGARLAAPTWRVPGLAAASERHLAVDVVVLNPDPRAAVAVRLVPAAGGEAPAGAVPAGSRVALSPATALGGGSGLVVEADGPVVVERVLREEDGRRVAAAPAVPAHRGTVGLPGLLAPGGPPG